MEYIQILEMLGTAIAASWLTRILTIRSRVRQEKAGAASKILAKNNGTWK